MIIEYQKYVFSISFHSPVTSTIPLTYLLRSLLGKELKFISCVLKTQKCSVCPLRDRCAYSVIFDNPISKNNSILHGRENISPPYIFASDTVYLNNSKSAKVTLTLIGNSVEYFPYLLLALERAGKAGIMKDRIPFHIESLNVMGQLYPLNFKFSSIQNSIYRFDQSVRSQHKSLILKLDTPFRYKIDGRYSDKINLSSILNACQRRLNILSGFYGDNTQVKIHNSDLSSVDVESNLAWVDIEHYSARQDIAMQLGGVTGTISINGELAEEALLLLEGGRLFNIGKSISFGLGKLEVMELL